jgi:hypothetical protein
MDGLGPTLFHAPQSCLLYLASVSLFHLVVLEA